MDYLENNLEKPMAPLTYPLQEQFRNRVLSSGYQWVIFKSRLRKRIRIYRTQLIFFYL